LVHKDSHNIEAVCIFMVT